MKSVFLILNVLNAFPGTAIYDKMITEAFGSGYSKSGQEVVESVKFDFLKNYFLRRDRLKKPITIQQKFPRKMNLFKNIKLTCLGIWTDSKPSMNW
jgi:hypothetical protein